MEDIKNYRILIIDDEKINLMILNTILAPDYTIFITKSGREGLYLAMTNKPDLILLDIIMPEMDGFQVLKALKTSENTRHIPVIVITSLDNEKDEEKGLILGAVDYIRKPLKNIIVKARVKTHIQIIQQIRISERLSMLDGLTNIPNRRCFNERISMEWGRSLRDKKPLSFIMLDIDNFKGYNDTYGHPQGDALLRTVAQIFAAIALRSTDFAARLGGEEFGVLLPDTDLNAAVQIAENIRIAVETTPIPTVEGKITAATVSAGVISTIPSQSISIEEFITIGDKNLYIAKKRGKNQVRFIAL
ncbi:MAG: diguanylate cyclase [Treponema sp.]|jgi:diguanylate cyclase (GGDEF)-like protein|nr:diguanylate cyclase [Treponema sp.]